MISLSMDAHREDIALVEFDIDTGRNKIHVLDSLSFLLAELFLPAWLISVHRLVHFLEIAEVRARRNSDGQYWCLLTHFLPRQTLVVFSVEIQIICQVHE